MIAAAIGGVVRGRAGVVLIACVSALGGGSSIPLPPVLEPVAHLGGREAGGLRQLALFRRIRVRVLEVPFAQEAARPLLEAVRLLLAVPDGARQRVLLAHAVLVDGAERAAAQLLGLQVVRLHPHGLELGVRVALELERLEE